MQIDLDKPMTELTVREYAWLLAWQAKHVTGMPTGTWVRHTANTAVSDLENALAQEARELSLGIVR
ncbi:hypothetical protein [Xanthomonas phage BUDD]|nr:hypothetical protein [Xanthomonas phage BUDD]